VPAGAHTIAVDVPDGDWMSVVDYTFARYVSDRFVRVDLYGIMNGRAAFLWTHNPDHNWLNRKSNADIATIHGATTAIHGLAPGPHTCEWWDTSKGEATAQDTIVCDNGVMRLTLPDLKTDVAASVRPAQQ
jgi:hypothetical protein